jgi:hypothetical protein
MMDTLPCRKGGCDGTDLQTIQDKFINPADYFIQVAEQSDPETMLGHICYGETQ